MSESNVGFPSPESTGPIVVDDKMGILRRALVIVTILMLFALLTVVVALAPDGALTPNPALDLEVALVIFVGFASLATGFFLFTGGYDQYRVTVTESGIFCKSLLESRAYEWRELLHPLPNIAYKRVGVRVVPRRKYGPDHERFSLNQWRAIISNPLCPETLKSGLSSQVLTFIHGSQRR